MNRLKELRVQHGYKNQKELADLLFVNQTAVSQWERGVTIPSSQMLIKLSELYGVSIDYLLGRDDFADKTKPANNSRTEQTPRHKISAEEYLIIVAYRKAVPADRQIIDNIVERYSSQVAGSKTG